MELEELRRLWNEKNAPKAHVHHGSPEHDLQVECVKYYRWKYPKGMLYANTNGGYRGDPTKMVNGYMNQAQAVGRRLVEEGQLHGIPDLTIPVHKAQYGACYLEMKNGKTGRLSEHQKKRIAELRELGNKVYVCRSIDDFMEAVDEYMALPSPEVYYMELMRAHEK